MAYLIAILDKLKLNSVEKTKIEALKSDTEIMKALRSFVKPEVIYKAFEQYYGIGMISLKGKSLDVSISKELNIEALKPHRIFPVSHDTVKKEYVFAVDNLEPTNIKTQLISMVHRKGERALIKYATRDEIEEAFGHKEEEQKVTNEDFDAVKFVDDMIAKALELSASDIHMERVEAGLQIRYRVDGVMSAKKIYNLDDGSINAAYVRLKGISNMDISEKRKAQDGRLDDYEYKDKKYDLRVSTVSTVLGEKAVMRIFNKSAKILSFEALGFEEQDTKKIKDMLHSQNGIILMAGATGSGKTTSLYTMIEEVNSDEVNIYTIEDPVEKTLSNINQIQIEPRAGIDYPSTLKALLRQDPDIIVVGEIRDTETAKLSVQASLTGHLVLSTVHANGALDAISRLLDMGVERYLLGASSQGFLSQRLVRKLCPHCKTKMKEFTPFEKKWLQSITEETINPETIYEAVGCNKCVKGYKGRIAIVEVIKISENLRELLSKDTPMHIIQERAELEGFTPMVKNALRKVLDGTTSIDEAIRKLS